MRYSIIQKPETPYVNVQGKGAMKKFEVFVDDNFHFMNEDERYPYGQFETLDDALAKCREIVDGSLLHLYKPGMSVRDLLDNYRAFGRDPWVNGITFDAWTYARVRCIEICNTKQASA